MKKVKKLIGFSQESLARLEDLKTRTRRTQTQIIEDLVLGRDRFAPDVESYINAACAATGLPREIVIERALLEAIGRGRKVSASRENI